MIGDVNFAEVEPIASHITPVPGGVGPMTITMLLFNTVQSAEIHYYRTNNLKHVNKKTEAVFLMRNSFYIGMK